MQSFVNFQKWLEVQIEGKGLKVTRVFSELKATRAQFELNLAF
jgi:hypothetical protein